MHAFCALAVSCVAVVHLHRLVAARHLHSRMGLLSAVHNVSCISGKHALQPHANFCGTCAQAGNKHKTCLLLDPAWQPEVNLS